MYMTCTLYMYVIYMTYIYMYIVILKNEVHICTCIYVCMKRTCTNHAGIA